MKNCVFLLSVFCVFSNCGNRNYYFNFDEIDYYKLKLNDEELMPLTEELTELSPKQKLQIEVIFEKSPKTVSDTVWINQLPKIGFAKKQISNNDFSEMNKVFSEKVSPDYLENICAPIWRDILVFKNQKNILGVAKICFECDLKYIIGTDVDTHSFGDSGEFEALKKILTKYK